MLVDLGDIAVNTDYIVAMTYDVPDGLILTMRGGVRIRVDSSWKDDLLGRFHVVQVIPLSEPMYAQLYEPDGPREAHEEIRYLGLCADGRVRALEQKRADQGREYVVIEEEDWDLYTETEYAKFLCERKIKEAES